MGDTSKRNAERADLPALLESLLFVADGPATTEDLAQALGVRKRLVEAALDELGESCRPRGIRVQRIGDKVQLVTAPEAAAYVERFLGADGPQRLSHAALETLAIIAYRQPITRAEIDAIRGVNSDRSLATLRMRGLVEEAGRAPGVGRSALWATTPRFLEHFGLERPEDLPPIDAIIADEPAAAAPAPWEEPVS